MGRPARGDLDADKASMPESISRSWNKKFRKIWNKVRRRADREAIKEQRDKTAG